jgi:hypothetical protein
MAIVANATAARGAVDSSESHPARPFSFDLPQVSLDPDFDTQQTVDSQPFMLLADAPQPANPNTAAAGQTPPEARSPYSPPQPPREDEGVNKGGVNLTVDVRYLTDYVYRGISHNRAAGGDPHASNFQADMLVSFNLGKLPHPYIGVFTNVNDSDPVSRFQEIWPFFGLTYTLRPIILDVGNNSYIYPERERLNPSPNTSEVYLKITIDDSYFFNTPQPILSPYVYAAYDYDRNNGWYLEAGLRHDFIFEDLGFTLTPYGDVGYISNFPQQFVVSSPNDSGFQHYDTGLVGTLSLNHLFQLSTPRFGEFAVQGYVTYTGRFSNQLLADSIVWGGVGLVFKY